ncbi:unnamed protein product [Microthlaspi erraticum]|uniref:Uncharacterized protein n=1 Tax=Microthlaspi erraticum TaxID=1685480 RepID=A0A6D2J682_9BRAS|nr:unnamed protein product [Microthlaspi erraticum]
MREVSDTLWNFHLTWRSKMTRSCFLRERKLRTASSCMITEPVSDDETDESNAIKRAGDAECRSPDPSAKELRARLEIRLKVQLWH